MQGPIYLTLALTFFNFVGANAARVVLTLYALELDAPASAVGVLGGLLYLFPLLLSWPIGMLADRAGARGLLLFAAVCAAVSLTLPYFFRALPAFYIAAALNGLALAFFHVTLQNLVGTLSRPEERARNFSNFSLAGAMTSFTGPMLAGFSIDTLGHAAACLVIALQSVIAIALLLAWGRLLPPGKPRAALDAGAPHAVTDREVWRMLVTSGMVQLGYDLFQFYLPIYGHSIGLSASAIGTILAMLAAAAFIVRLFLARLMKRVPGETLLAWVFFTGAIGFALVPFSGNAVVLGLIAFIFGLGMGIGIPLTVILMFASSAEGRSGQTLGLRLTANNFVRVTGPIVFGAVGSAFGLPAVFWIVAAILTSGGLLSRSRTHGGAK
ncbi:MAG TPA: MFS transporter [Burkholderiales bacterium]|nr:MFS transporter [Burkholderiales bacterium]